MRRFYAFIAAVLSVCLLASCGGGKIIYDSQTAKDGGQGAWTVLVYMMGGSEETENGSFSAKLDEIMSADHAENVNVVIETGGSAVWHKNGVYSEYLQRFLSRDKNLYLTGQTAAANMGDAETLADFLNWGIENYNSEHYMLIIAGSGGGSMYGIGSDEIASNDGLSLEEIAHAMNLAGRSFDIVGLDASLMGSFETLSALSAYTDYLVAPQDIQDFDSWDYKTFLSYLSAHTNADAEEIGRVICDSYYNRAIRKGTEKYVSISLSDASNASTLGQALDGMAGDMLLFTESMPSYTTLSEALSYAHIYGGASEDEGYSDLMDLGSAAIKVRECIGTTSDLLLNTLSKTVVYLVCGDEQSSSSGMSFFYPLSQDSDRLQEYMSMSTSSKYKEFLRRICVNCNVNDEMTTDYTASQSWNTYNADMSLLEYQTLLDNNSYELYVTGNMDLFRSAAINVYMLDNTSGKYVFIGKNRDIQTDWDGGVFIDNFSGVLPEFEGKAVSPTLIRTYEDCDLYAFPAVINGKICSVRAKYDYTENKFETIGVWSGLDGAGLAKSALGEADGSLTPLLPAYDEQHLKGEYVLGASVKANGSFDSGKTDDGKYIFEYELTDIYGQKRYGTPVNATLNGRKITYE